ncbi:MAG: glycoside hydrolase, partial [Pedobacter sp.]
SRYFYKGGRILESFKKEFTVE